MHSQMERGRERERDEPARETWAPGPSSSSGILEAPVAIIDSVEGDERGVPALPTIVPHYTQALPTAERGNDDNDEDEAIVNLTSFISVILAYARLSHSSPVPLSPPVPTVVGRMKRCCSFIAV